MTENIAYARRTLQAIGQALVDGFSFVLLLAAALILNLAAAIGAMAAAAMLFLCIRPLSRYARRQAQTNSRLNHVFATEVNHMVTMVREIRVYNITDVFKQHLSALVGKVRKSRMMCDACSAFVPIVYQNASALIVVGAIGAAYYLQISDLSRLAMAAVLLVRSLAYGQYFQANYHSVMEGIPYLEQLHTALDELTGSTPHYGDRRLERIEAIDFQDVWFRFGSDDWTLKALSFTVSDCEVIGLVGPSGSGKTTMMQLLLRLRQPQRGCIHVNKQPIDKYAAESWSRKVV